jgi:TPR repeat protein
MKPDPTFFDPPVSNLEGEDISFWESESELVSELESPFTLRQRLAVFALALAAFFGGAYYTSVKSVKNNRQVEKGVVTDTEFQAMALTKQGTVADQTGYNPASAINPRFVFSGTLPLAEPIPVSLESLPADLPELTFEMTEQDYLVGLDNNHPFGQVDDLLAELRKQTNFPDSDIDVIYQKLIQQQPKRDLTLLKNWIGQARGEEGGIYLAIAFRYSDAGDHDAAFACFQRSVDETHSAEAYFQVGAAQLFGLGTPTNFSLAQKNLFRSLREDHPSAAYLLGMIYLSGVCGTVNEAHAYQFFQIAIEKGNRLACGEAGRMRETGLGVAKDLARAQELYHEGAESGDTYCIKQLVRLQSAGQLDASVVTPDEVAEYQILLPTMHNEELSVMARQLLPGELMR